MQTNLRSKLLEWKKSTCLNKRYAQDVKHFVKRAKLPSLVADRVMAHCGFSLQRYHHGSERVMAMLSNTLRRDVLMQMYAGLLG
jgi:hypothetical protein